jgi:prepilin-type N-terminal cleavage/methylation domain-containing protein
MSQLSRLKDDRGETLLEVLVAVVILGIAAVAIVSGMAVNIKVSDIHRKQANAGVYVRNYAESLESTVAGGGYAAGTAAYAAYAVPSGYAASLPLKECWTGSAWATCTSGNDIGVQRLTLQVKSSDQRTVERLVVVVRRPCTPAQGTCS